MRAHLDLLVVMVSLLNVREMQVNPVLIIHHPWPTLRLLDFLVVMVIRPRGSS